MTFGSIAEMQKFVERYPELNKTKDNVSKHVNLLHALSRIVDAHSVMEVSEVEQQLAAVQDHRAAQKQVLLAQIVIHAAVCMNDVCGSRVMMC